MKPQVSLLALTKRTQLEESFELMKLLRPGLASAPLFAEQVIRQFEQGYQLLGAVHEGAVVGLIGFREIENLLYGRFIYVDDLVVATEVRHLGLGASLLAAVREEAANRRCAYLVLDTGLHMPLAQRFYFREGMLARGMHFVQPLST